MTHANRDPKGSASPIEKTLGQLENVKETRPGRWIASCPAHEDKSPSLSIRELDDGRVLVHCFGGCETGDVMEAIGLRLADLYAQRLKDYLPPVKGGFTAKELLTLLIHETWVVAIIATDAAERPLTEEERGRLATATARIWRARELAHGC